MTTLTNTFAFDFAFPSLTKLAQRFAIPAVHTAAPNKAPGLSFGDIADASLRATKKHGLKPRRFAPAKLVA